MEIDPNIYVGQQFGIYKIIEVLPEKDKYGHYVYKGECQECGFIKTGAIGDFKNKNVQKCYHIGRLTQEQIDTWYVKNKKQCLYCGKDIPLGDLGFNEYRERKFCSQSCAASYNNIDIDRHAASRIEKIKSNHNLKIQIDNSQGTPRIKLQNYCKSCGKEIEYKKQFCNQQCFNDFKYKEYIQKWQDGLEDGMKGIYSISRHIRRYLYEKNKNKCSKCGWGEMNPYTGKIPLEVHHKDGDYTNNSEENLELLCPNCHALTSTYKAANKNFGRKDRKKYYENK